MEGIYFAPGKEAGTGRCGDVGPYFADANIPQSSSVDPTKVPFPSTSGTFTIPVTGNCVYTGDGKTAGWVKCKGGTVSCSPYQTGTVKDCGSRFDR
jgi:hypothetical protein